MKPLNKLPVGRCGPGPSTCMPRHDADISRHLISVSNQAKTPGCAVNHHITCCPHVLVSKGMRGLAIAKGAPSHHITPF